ISGGGELHCYLQRILKLKIQTGFRIDSDLLAFSNGFDSDSCACAGSASENRALASACDCTNCGSDSSSDSGRSCCSSSLRGARIYEFVAFERTACLSKKNAIQLKLQLASAGHTAG